MPQERAYREGFTKDELRIFLQKVTGDEDVDAILEETLRETEQQSKPAGVSVRKWVFEIAQAVAVRRVPVV